MAWLKNLKKLFGRREEAAERNLERITLEKLPGIIEEKERKISLDKAHLKKEVQKRISQLENDLREPITELKKKDISSRKDYVRIKEVVEKNLSLYLIYLERFISELGGIENKDEEEFAKKVFQSIHEFNRLATRPFENATLLIGTELGSIRDRIKRFSKEVSDLAENNKWAVAQARIIQNIKTSLEEINQNTASLEEANKSTAEINGKIEKDKARCIQITQEIENIKNSEGYKKDAEEKREAQKRISELENRIQSIKQRMNLREMAKEHHFDKKKSQLINAYSANFKEALREDRELDILNLVSLEKKSALEPLKKIQSEIGEISAPAKTPSEKKISALEDEMSICKSEILALEDEVRKNTKRKERLEIKRKETSEEIHIKSREIFPEFEIVERA